jgi:hypothetical protein
MRHGLAALRGAEKNLFVRISRSCGYIFRIIVKNDFRENGVGGV